MVLTLSASIGNVDVDADVDVDALLGGNGRRNNNTCGSGVCTM